MKTIIFTLTLLISNFVIGQSIPNMDTTKSILLVSHYQSIDKPALSLFKGHHDIIFFINTNDKDIFAYTDAEYAFAGHINQVILDSTGHIHIFFTIYHEKGGKLVNKSGKICYTIGDDFFTLVKNGKTVKHTKIKCEFHKEKLFNVDIVR